MAKRVGNIELGVVLGVGGFGKVYMGHDTVSNKDVAVKIIDKDFIRQHGMEEYIQREIEIMQKIKHDHVIKLLQVVELPRSFCLVMELARNGELFDRILQSKRFGEPEARDLFHQLMSAVCYCHQKGVVHRDLKAENLLLGEGNELKVCDFGLSRYTFQKHVPDGEIVFTSLAGSTDYQAPEVIGTEGYHGVTCDVWSCGVILYFMLTGQLPFAARSEAESERLVLAGKWRRHKALSADAEDLIGKILTVDTKKRYTTDEIIAHDWFQVDLNPDLFPEHRVKPGPSPTAPRGESFYVADTEGAKEATAAEDEAAAMLTGLRSAFRTVNVDRSGHLSRCEVRDVLIELNDGNPVEASEVSNVMECFTLSGDGTVSEDEFIVGWGEFTKRTGGKVTVNRLIDLFHIELEQRLLADLRKAFDRLDMNHNGVLTAENVMAVPELNLGEEEVEQLIGAMDKHHHKTVTFEDFVTACTTADLLRCHSVGTKLQRVGELFDAIDSHSYMAYVNTGFTVAGMRETIQTRILADGPKFNMTFDEGESGNYLHGAYVDDQGRKLEVGCQLLPTVTGYTRVLSYRIGGKTEVFHSWFGIFRKLLQQEIVRCVEDTVIVGEPELM
jgi:serine/threonine protein kinase